MAPCDFFPPIDAYQINLENFLGLYKLDIIWFSYKPYETIHIYNSY